MRGLPHTLLFILLISPVFLHAQGKKKKAVYDACIASADSAFGKKNYQFAKQKYQQAADAMPKETYPKERLTECDNQAAFQKKEYRRLCDLGDSCMQVKEYSGAKTYYEQAEKIDPNDPYAHNQLLSANYNLTAAAAMNQRYNRIMKSADSCYEKQSWSCAQAKYSAALGIKPGDIYIQSRIDDCQKKIDAAVKEEKYTQLISIADQRFTSGDYAGAKAKYAEALI